MRHLYTFILTVLLDVQESGLFCGRVRSIATGAETTFNGLDEMVAWIRRQVDTGGEDVQEPSSKLAVLEKH